MDSNVSYVTNFFLQQHICLNEEWLGVVLEMLQQQQQRFSQDILAKAVFQQWIHSDISESTLPSFQLPDQTVKLIKGVFVFQVVSVYDIGSSIYSQYRAATQKLDNYDFFDALPKEEQTKEVQFAKVSIEYRSIPQISTTIIPGAKILIYGSIQKRNNILWLNASNCQLLGGDLDTLCEANEKESFLGRKLKIDKYKNATVPQNSQSKTSSSSPIKISQIISASIIQDENTPPATSTQMTTVSRVARYVPEVITLSPCKPVRKISKAEVENVVSSKFSKTIQKRPLKIEVQDEDISILLQSPPPSTPTSSTFKSPKRKRSRTDDTPSPNSLVEKFKELKLLKIKQSLSLMKFSIGSKKVKIAAILLDIIEPFNIEDGEWTMKIRIRDETHENLDCYISHQLLCRLIGMTPDEAVAIRKSSNLAKRKEGTERIKTLDLQLQRLDLIFEIEFFAANRATPRIIEMETFTNALQIC
uniref:RecQ-mediated genome instability protein 1 n=1 Tax=Panagrolaimus sp. PS1159 TaxID=55785 RepID=A0AC35F422_9BILA